MWELPIFVKCLRDGRRRGTRKEALFSGWGCDPILPLMAPVTTNFSERREGGKSPACAFVSFFLLWLLFREATLDKEGPLFSLEALWRHVSRLSRESGGCEWCVRISSPEESVKKKEITSHKKPKGVEEGREKKPFFFFSWGGGEGGGKVDISWERGT